MRESPDHYAEITYFSMTTSLKQLINRILCGDAHQVIKQLPDDSVDCVVTSPPYWGLRDYGVKGQIGMERTLGEHIETLVEVFCEIRRVVKPAAAVWLNYGDCYATSPNGR